MSTRRGAGVSRPPFDDGAGHGGFNLGTHVGDLPAHVAQNRASLRALLPADPVWLMQVHGSNVIDAADAVGVPQTDASLTTRPGVVCAVMTADCLPVLFCDFAGTVVAAAHAGWRGLAGGVLQQTIAAMRAAGAGDITAWLGPAIGPQHFEVGDDVVSAFDGSDPAARNAFVASAGKPGKYLADIYQLARLILHAQGVSSISGGDRCTVREQHEFFSFRRDGQTGRMASLIWIQP
ncbi:YfiH family protein [Actimicrobium sp. GrIS 1.19]|uniref:peptidoglycan editing factor PgeF n=1 Tax=Actimicrobium sp. GrIS 1.19 TaxID=3071708 RepID=UPI002DFAF598|nr:YfiH family protein [Actimicrobium sp. GrIS 1.19]